MSILSLIALREWCTNKLRKEETERKRKMRFLGHAAQWRSAAKEALDRTSITVNFLCWLHFTSNYLCSPFHVFISKIQAFLPFLVLFGYSFDSIASFPACRRMGLACSPLSTSPATSSSPTISLRYSGTSATATWFSFGPL